MAVHYITGDNEAVLAGAVRDLVDRLVGDGDRSLMVDDFDGEEYEIRAVVDAAQTPPFLTDRRVVVARGVGRFDADGVASLAAYLADPLPTTELVLVGGGGRVPKVLTEALKRHGAVTTDASPPTRAADRTAWIADQLLDGGVKLDSDARRALATWLGDDVGRLDGIIDTLRSAFGARTLSFSDIAPYLGDAGGVPPWDFTDAIDAGDTTTALRMLHRMMGGGERHPLQLMAVLHNHYARLLAIDGLNLRDETAAAAAMGIKPGYPAKKAMQLAQRLGSTNTHRAIDLLGQADLDLRGEKDWPETLVMEVLVARLSRLAGARR
jgi:DNA polymerase-3 subunit delta